jgi:hypothetical protein
MNDRRQSSSHSLIMITLLVALASACGGESPETSVRGAAPAPSSPSDETQCLESACRAEISSCGPSCVALNGCIADCKTEACVRSCVDAASTPAVDQLLALYECHEANCEAGSSDSASSCEDIGAMLPGTIWTGVLCEDGSTRSPCPTGSEKVVYYYRFNRDGTYQLHSISDFGGRISTGGKAGSWRTSCGTLSLLTCGGDEVDRIATDDGIRVGPMLLERWDSGVDLVPFDYRCR